MTQAAVAVVQAYYDALAQGDMEGLFSACDRAYYK
jgi:ketosteroid isomerase-like protein